MNACSCLHAPGGTGTTSVVACPVHGDRRVDPRDRISAACWDGDHHRCAGRVVVPTHRQGRHGVDQTLTCACTACNHRVAP